MELGDNWFGSVRVPWNSMKYSIEFHATLVSFEMAPSKIHESSIELSILQFHAILHGIPSVQGNRMSLKLAITKFHWSIERHWTSITSDSATVLHVISWKIPWKSKGPWCQCKWWSPWNSGIAYLAAPEFHGIPQNILCNSMEFRFATGNPERKHIYRSIWIECCVDDDGTVYPKKYAHGFVVLCFVVVMQSFIMNSHEVFIHIHQGCFAGTGAIVRLPQCQWSKPDGYGKISQCMTTTKHSKAKTVCTFLGIYCNS